jgi:hypothetical protein
MEPTGMERVTMLWPSELKNAVRAAVGARGITKFTIAAVEDKLAAIARTGTPTEAQTAASATHDTEADEAQQLTVDTVAATKAGLGPRRADLAFQGRIRERVAVDQHILRRLNEVETAQESLKSAADPPPQTRARINDLKERFGLVSASSLPVPEPATEETPAEIEADLLSDICPNCKSPLIDGECWTCNP